MSRRNDAAELTYFVEQELENVRDEVENEYPMPAYPTIVPVDSSDPEGAETVGYIQIDKVGMSQIIADASDDSPSVDAVATKITLPVHEIGNNFSYTEREIRNGMMARQNGATRTPLDSQRATISAESVEQHHDAIAMVGDGTKNKRFGGMYGVVYQPNFTKIAATNTWENLTDDEILAEFGTMYRRIVKDTKEVHRPDTWAMSEERMAYLRERKNTNTDRSLLERLQATYPNMAWITHFRLDSEEITSNPATGAPGNFNVVICYKRQRSVLRYKMPMAYKTYSPVWEGRSTRIEAASTSAGVEARQPLAVVIYYGA